MSGDSITEQDIREAMLRMWDMGARPDQTVVFVGNASLEVMEAFVASGTHIMVTREALQRYRDAHPEAKR